MQEELSVSIFVEVSTKVKKPVHCMTQILLCDYLNWLIKLRVDIDNKNENSIEYFNVFKFK